MEWSNAREPLGASPEGRRAWRLQWFDRVAVVLLLLAAGSALVSLVGRLAGFFDDAPAATGGAPFSPGNALLFLALCLAIGLNRDSATHRLLPKGWGTRLARLVPLSLLVTGLALVVAGAAGVRTSPWVPVSGGFSFALLGAALVMRKKHPRVAFAITLFFLSLILVLLLWLAHAIAGPDPVGPISNPAIVSVFAYFAAIWAMFSLDAGRPPIVVFVEETPAGSAARTLVLPALIFVPLIGYLRVLGERAGYYDDSVGVTIGTSALLLLFLVLIAITVRALRGLEGRRAAAAEAARLGERRFSVMFHASPIAMTLAAMPDGRYLDINEAAAQLFEAPLEAAVGKTPAELSVMDGAARASLAAGLSAEGRARGIEVTFRRSGGEVRTALVSVEPLDLAAGKAALAVYVDITDRKRAAESLVKSQATLAQAQAIGHVGSWEWDAVRDEATWSDEMFRIFGLDPAEPAANLARATKMIVAEDQETFAGDVKAAVEGPNPYSSEYRIRRVDGSVRFLSARGEAVRDAKGRAVRMVGAVQDVTEQRVAERVREEILDVISHEFRTPVTIIQGYADVLASGRLPASAEQTAAIRTKIDRAGKHLTYLLHSIYELSQLRAGKSPVRLESLPSREVIGEAIEVAQIRRPDPSRALQVTVEEGAAQIPGDRRKLAIALSELLDNAVKFSPQGSPIRVAARARGGGVVVEVADRGPGLPAAVIRDLGRPFSQHDMSSTRAAGGAGLGLAVAHGLVSAMGARIEVDSSPGTGTTMRLVFPAPASGQV